ncbi:MAG: methionine aminotransferase [Alcaligenaceae bacterium]|nr:methionine aminotransferase [Alcaligenaceae bacterium]
MKLRSKLPNTGVTIFTEMNNLAARYQAINMGQGFPDFSPDDRLIECVHEALLGPHNQYAPMGGVPALREAIADKIDNLYGRRYDPELEITVTSGATEALNSTITALIHPGDEAIVIEPAYDLYAPVIRVAGGVPRYVQMTVPTAERPQFSVNWDAVESAITPKTRIIILNFPNNPTGITIGQSDLDRVERIVNAHADILILSDEAYEHIVFDGEDHLSLAGRPSLAERSIIISSFAKTFHVTGWKIGYCCAPPHIMAEIRKVHQFTVFSVPTPLQVGLAQYLNQYANTALLSPFYQKKRDRLAKGLADTRFKSLYSAGTFFLLMDYSTLSGCSETEAARALTEHHGVTAIPVSAFYDDPESDKANHNLLRLCFAKQDPTIDATIDRLVNVETL